MLRRYIYIFIVVICAIPIIGKPADAESIGVVRLLERNGGGHFYTTSCDEANQARLKYNYAIEGFGFNIYDTQVSGSVPFYRLFGFNDHLYTASEGEKNALAGAGWNVEGILGWVFPNAQPNHVPLYRAFQPTAGRHFYTTDKREYESIPAQYGYRLEGIAAYVPNIGKQCQIAKEPPSGGGHGRGGGCWRSYECGDASAPRQCQAWDPHC